MKRLKRYLLRAALILATLYAATLGALYFAQETLLFHPQILAADYAFHFPAPYREIRLPVAGAELHGLHFRHENPQGAIVFFHGNAGSLAHWGKIGAQLAALGYDCYLWWCSKKYADAGVGKQKLKRQRADALYCVCENTINTLLPPLPWAEYKEKWHQALRQTKLPL